MEPPDDPYGWITEVCRGSSSEDNRSRSPSYFGQPDSDDSDSDSDSQKMLDIPVASTGITMVSLPESPKDEARDDTETLHEDEEIFHTPPESRSTSWSFDNSNDDQMVGADPYNNEDTVSAYADSGDSRKAVDLGRDKDLGFSEVEVGVDSTQRIEVDSSPNDAFPMKSEEIRVSKRGFSPEGQSSVEPFSKKVKSLDFESPIVCSGTPEEENSEEVLKALEKWKLEMDSLYPGASSELQLESQQNHEGKTEVGEGSVRKARLDFSAEIIDSEDEERHTKCENNNGQGSDGKKSLDPRTKNMQCDLEERNPFSELGNDFIERISGRNKKTVEDTDRFRYIGENGSNSREMEEKTERKRELPSWATGRVDSGEMEEKTERKRALPSWVRFDERVEINERESIRTNMASNNLSKDGSNLPETRGKVERKRALPSWANESMEADQKMEVNATESERAEVNEVEPGRVGVDERLLAQSNTILDSLTDDLDVTMLLDVLAELKEEQNYEVDRNLACMNLWEVAQLKGIEDTDSSAE